MTITRHLSAEMKIMLLQSNQNFTLSNFVKTRHIRIHYKTRVILFISNTQSGIKIIVTILLISLNKYAEIAIVL